MHEHYLEKTGTYYRTNDFVVGRKTLVFIHGLSGSSSAWAPYETFFQDDYNILTYDIRGHGKSLKYPLYSDYEMQYFVSELDELLRHLTIQSCVLVSHSFATLTALTFIEHHKEKVSELVLLSPILFLEKRWLARVIKPLLSATRALELVPFRKKTGTHVDYTHFPNTGDWNIPRMIADVSNTSLRVYLFVSRQAYEVHPEKILQNLRIPTLIMHGTHDTISPTENSLQMKNTASHISLITIDNADHILVLNYPQKVCGAIKKFLA